MRSILYLSVSVICTFARFHELFSVCRLCVMCVDGYDSPYGMFLIARDDMGYLWAAADDSRVRVLYRTML